MSTGITHHLESPLCAGDGFVGQGDGSLQQGSDVRPVTDSGGHTEERFVILTELQLGVWRGDVEMTLTARDNMRFRMLIGRTTLAAGGFAVDPARSYLGSPAPTQDSR